MNQIYHGSALGLLKRIPDNGRGKLIIQAEERISQKIPVRCYQHLVTEPDLDIPVSPDFLTIDPV